MKANFLSSSLQYFARAGSTTELDYGTKPSRLLGTVLSKFWKLYPRLLCDLRILRGMILY